MTSSVTHLERARDAIRRFKAANPNWVLPRTCAEASIVPGLGPRALDALIAAGDIVSHFQKPLVGLPSELHSLLSAGLKKISGDANAAKLTTRKDILTFLEVKGVSLPSAMRRFSLLPIASDRQVAMIHHWLKGNTARYTPSRKRCKGDHPPRMIIHLAWTPKSQVLNLTGSITGDCADLIEATCENNRWRIIKLSISPNFIHLHVKIRRTDSAFSAIEDLKHHTQDGLRARHPDLSRFTDLWNRRYYASTTGYKTAIVAIKRFVAAQHKVIPNPLIEVKNVTSTPHAVAA